MFNFYVPPLGRWLSSDVAEFSSLQSLDGFFEIIINYTILMSWPGWPLPPKFYNKSVVISWKVHNLRQLNISICQRMRRSSNLLHLNTQLKLVNNWWRRGGKKSVLKFVHNRTEDCSIEHFQSSVEESRVQLSILLSVILERNKFPQISCGETQYSLVGVGAQCTVHSAGHTTTEFPRSKSSFLAAWLYYITNFSLSLWLSKFWLFLPPR